MDPNQWRNYNQAYGHLGHSTGISPAASNLNRFDLPLLNPDQGALGTGLGLPPSLQSHPSAVSARSMGAISAVPVSYAHPLHNPMSQFLEAVNPLQSFPSQNPYKSLPVGQSSFGLDSAALRSPEQTPSLYGYTAVGESRSLSKPLFGQESHLPKDAVSSFALSTPTSQHTEKTSKSGWGLSNFVPTPSTPFGNFSGSDGSQTSEQPGPPPAHSGNSSSNRLSSIQRNPLPMEDLFSHTSLSKSSHLPHSFLDKHEDLLLNSQPLLRSEASFSTPSGHGIEDLTKPTSQNVFSNFSTPISSKSDTSTKYESSVKYQTQLSSDVNYEPVSPPNSLSDNGPSSQSYNPVNLQDLNPLSQPPTSSLKLDRGIMHQDSSQVIMHAHSNSKSGSLQNIPQELSINLHSTQSPLQQSPVSVGGSPHMQMPMSSPQTPLPTSTVVQAPPPIQAIPDSTTKPKRGRGRKKKDPDIEKNKTTPKFSQETIASHHMRGDMIGMTSQIQNQTNMMGMGNQTYQQSNPYSPQKPYSPHTSQQFSPKKSPQSYSPQIQQQQMMEKVYNSNQPSPLMEKHYPLPPSMSNNLTQNPMQQQLPSSSGGMIVSASNQMPLMADSVIRSNQGGVIHSMTTPSTSSPQGHMSVSSMSLANSLSIANPPLVDGMDGTNYNFNHVSSQSFVEQLQSDMPDHLNKSPMDDPLSMPALELAEPHGQYLSQQENASYVSPPANSIYTDLDNFNNQFGHPQPGLTSPNMGFNSPCNNNTSTIDEDALSSLIGNPSMRETSPMKDLSPDRMRHRTKAEQKHMPTLTVTCQPEFDDDFQHLTKPPTEKKEAPDTMKPKFTPRLSAVPIPKPAEIPPLPPAQPKPEPNVLKPKNSSNSFMDSFLSFIQGKKPETLSSVNMANVKKPELPKYIPEPRRHRPIEATDNKTSSDSAASTPRGDTEFSSNTGGNSPSTSQNEDTANSVVAFSDDDEEGNNITSTVQNVLSHLDDSVSGKKESLKMKITLGKPGLHGSSKKSSKVNTIGGKVKKHLKSGKKTKSNRSKSLSQESSVVMSSGDEEIQLSSSEEEVEKEVKPPSPAVPLRQLSTRKAKEKGIQKQKKYKDSSDSDISIPDPIKKEDDENDYDSDKDPAWTPFAVDNKRQPTYDQVDFEVVRSRSRPKPFAKGKGRTGKKQAKRPKDSYDPPIPVKVQRMSSEDNMNGSQKCDNDSEHIPPDTEVQTAPGFSVGDYVMDKKDLNNYESFPIWKIESGRMIRKFELITEHGMIRHRSLCTVFYQFEMMRVYEAINTDVSVFFSSWLPAMQKDYVPIKVKVVSWMKDKEIVEVSDEDKPKPKLDRSLEHAYEEDPLADLFNVYLQIFLSQALEPGFLSAIGEEIDNFYMGPLKSIDKTIEKKLQAIEERVQWRDTFRKALRAKPHIRELDRPNLKQSCQACEVASQPAIKSIHLFGQSYDHFSLEEHPSSSTEGGSVEFMIGKTAANNVGVYHSLYHFKYNLYKRCLAKVDIVKQNDADLDNAEVLDRCLNNRTWVLKIFDDLKTMLDKG